ncbi:glycoside hydrolase family protein [Novosphingobium sp. Rr 2-17]|uniref:glycoside hydrolase family 16 protein n=1 Tax=Novosphingobium sp. Rr 2-17 TaxID=555793 RepID=UPI0002699EFA|nr:glycoside hydrolase family 16 protein [Novosphingobium sp. Rr 2-17]EIZ78458.1 glycoside hydrolase family protein [Novosphingobium sp. Rr 2-17]
MIRAARDGIVRAGLRYRVALSLSSVALLVGAIGLLVAIAGPDFLALAQPDSRPALQGLPLERQLPIAGLTRTFTEDFSELRFQGQGQGKGGAWRTTFANHGLAAYTLPTNQEKQIYVDRQFRGSGNKPLNLNPFAIRDGVLTITASPVDAATARQMWGYRYASGQLNTKGVFAQKYGYFEVRARLSDTSSMWPAIWLLPADGTWPPEVDIFEQLGREPSRIYMSTVSHPKGAAKPAYTHAEITVPTAATQFHRYGMLWDARSITFYIDGSQVSRVPTPPDMHRPMYLLVNLAVGGPWAHDPPTISPPRGSMAIDYIHAYAVPNST